VASLARGPCHLCVWRRGVSGGRQRRVSSGVHVTRGCGSLTAGAPAREGVTCTQRERDARGACVSASLAWNTVTPASQRPRQSQCTCVARRLTLAPSPATLPSYLVVGAHGVVMLACRGGVSAWLATRGAVFSVFRRPQSMWAPATQPRLLCGAAAHRTVCPPRQTSTLLGGQHLHAAGHAASATPAAVVTACHGRRRARCVAAATAGWRHFTAAVPRRGFTVLSAAHAGTHAPGALGGEHPGEAAGQAAGGVAGDSSGGDGPASHKLVTFYCLARVEDPHAEVEKHKAFCQVRRRTRARPRRPRASVWPYG
jgi:hypothetical protein